MKFYDSNATNNSNSNLMSIPHSSKKCEAIVEKLSGDKMLLDKKDFNRQGSQVHKDVFNRLKCEFTAGKSIYRDDILKRTVISFEKKRVHYGVPYNGLYIHPPRFASDYDVATNAQTGDKFMIPKYVEIVLIYDGKAQHNASFRCASLNDMFTRVRELRDRDDADCDLSNLSFRMG